MAVTFDAVGPNSSGTSVTINTSLTWSHSCSGSNGLLVVGVSVGAGQNGTSTTATYNGVSMTSAGRVFSNNQQDGYVEMFYLVAPSTGSNTVAITCSQSLTMIGGSVSFNGVDQSTPVSNITSAFGSASPVSLSVTSAAGNMVVDAVCTGTGVTSSDQTQRWLRNDNGTTAAGNAAQSTADGAASVNMGYTITSDWWGMMGMSVNASSGGGGGGNTSAWLTA